MRQSYRLMGGALLGVVIPALSAHAAPTNLIQNPSFEADNAELVNQPVTAWTFQSDEQAGVIAANATTYFPNDKSGVDGSYIAFFNNRANQAAQAFPSTPPVTRIAANTTYTLIAALGNEAGTGDYKDPGQFQLQLYDNANRDQITGDLVAASPLITPADGTMTDYQVSFTTGADGVDPLVGQPLEPQIKLFSGSSGTGTFYQSPFDNVRLYATTPEPASLSLLALGGVGLLARRRRSA